MNHKIITEVYSLVQIMEKKDKDGKQKKRGSYEYNKMSNYRKNAK